MSAPHGNAAAATSPRHAPVARAVTRLVLYGLVGVLAGLLAAAGGLATLSPGRARRWVARSIGTLAALGAAMVAVWLAMGGAPAAAVLPFGGPGFSITLALDPLAGFFLLTVLLVGAAASMAGGQGAVLLAGLLLAVLAGDVQALLLGLGIAVLAGALSGLGDDAQAGRVARGVGLTVLGLTLLAAALAMADPWEIGDLSSAHVRFADLRNRALDDWRVAGVMGLTVASLAALASAAVSAARLASPPVAALLLAAVPHVGLYVLIRVLFDLIGPVQSPGWGAPLIMLGLGLGLGVAIQAWLCAIAGADLRVVVGWAAVAQLGVVVAGLGIALAARAADAGPPATLALGGALLLGTAQALLAALLVLAAGSVAHGAGTARLDLLGGVLRAMPITSACMLLAAFGMTALPPAAGFAGIWTLYQAVFAAPGLGGLGWQAMMALAVAALALAQGLGIAAMLRLVGVVLLGRPRSPRAAAAEEARPALRWAMLALATLATLVGLFPAAVLALAAPVLRSWAGAAPAGGIGIAPAGIVVVLALAGGLVVLVHRARAAPRGREAPAWEGGAPEPPAWLPFGDPATQIGAAGFSAPLLRPLRAPWISTVPRWAIWMWHRLARVAGRIGPPSLRGGLTALLCSVLVLLVAIVGR